jgi:hypothetical protein
MAGYNLEEEQRGRFRCSVKHMTLTFKYRITSLTLSVVFALFNIGVPVVVASCPMMKYADSKQCMMCDTGPLSNTVKFTRAANKSCCETKYAADRNKTEFLQTAQHLLDSTKLLVVFVTNSLTQSAIRNPQFTITVDTSPPRTADIPILVSSLLI